MDVAASAWLGVLAGCADLEVSSNSDDPASQGTVVSAASGAALAAGLVALLTEGGGTGVPVDGRRDIALAIARGEGPFVTDLAAWLQLPESLLPALGACLREARPVLGAALDEPITRYSFETLIGVALCRDPTLRYHAWKRFNCARLAPPSTLQGRR